MKRTIALFLILSIALALAACGAPDPSQAIVGTWKSASGYSCTFKADGTGSVNVERGTTASCTWTYNEEAGNWEVNYGYNKDTATVTSGENGYVLVWQGSNYDRVG